MPTFLWPLLLLLTCSAPPARSPNVHTSVESPHTPAPGTSCLDHMWTQVKFSHDVPGMTVWLAVPPLPGPSPSPQAP
ncbi:unnamed protein product [Rangifer tarandus platyrhynchus]|uniref:Uncharacterized protein n=1 Tax=Rangifer tarandus platyrhynchus TaxID=3082113 RepID=A0AC59ZYM5_RANTA